MKSRLVRIGNSRGIRLPKVLIEEAGLLGESRSASGKGR
jgi:antitoxin component of MazEF toxin-antitoxin module